MDSIELNDMYNELVAMEKTLYMENKDYVMLERVRSLIEVTKQNMEMYGWHEEKESRIAALEEREDELSEENAELEDKIAGLEDYIKELESEANERE